MSQQSFHQQTATGADINFTITTFSSDEIKRVNIFSRLLKSFNYLIWGDV